MTPPQSPHPDRYNSAVLGGLLFVLYNAALAGTGVLGSGRALVTIQQLLLFGNLVIPFVAVVKGKSRFAVGWATAIGILLLAALGLCIVALQNA